MLTEEYDYYRRRATQEELAAEIAQDEGVRQVHRELAAAYRSRCQALCEDPAAYSFCKSSGSAAGGFILMPKLAPREALPALY